MHAKWDWQYPVAQSWIRCTQFVASSYQWQTLRGSIQIRYVHPRISWKHRRKRKWQGERRTKDNTDSSYRLIFVWFVWPKAICRSFLLLLCHLFRFMLPCERRTLFSLHNYCLAFYVHNTHFSCVFFFNFFSFRFFHPSFCFHKEISIESATMRHFSFDFQVMHINEKYLFIFITLFEEFVKWFLWRFAPKGEKC